MVIVGCGRVGARLAGFLDTAGHDVVVVDRDAVAMGTRLPAGFGGRTVTGSAFDRDVLDAAGVDGADAFVAVTDGDNTNIVAARVARETYGVADVVARVYDPARAAMFEQLGIPTIATVVWTTDQILRRLLPTELPPSWVDPLGQTQLHQLPAPREWVGRRYRAVEAPGRFAVSAICRDSATTPVTDTSVCQDGDVIFVMVATADVDILSGLAGAGRTE